MAERTTLKSEVIKYKLDDGTVAFFDPKETLSFAKTLEQSGISFTAEELKWQKKVDEERLKNDPLTKETPQQ